MNGETIKMLQKTQANGENGNQPVCQKLCNCSCLQIFKLREVLKITRTKKEALPGGLEIPVVSL